MQKDTVPALEVTRGLEGSARQEGRVRTPRSGLAPFLSPASILRPRLPSASSEPLAGRAAHSIPHLMFPAQSIFQMLIGLPFLIMTLTGHI